MGYRSEVCFSITKKLFNIYSALLKKLLENCDEVKIGEVYSDYNCKEKIEVYYFIWTGVKWYFGDDAVNIIEGIIKQNPDDCSLTRIGEDDNDLEYLGNRDHQVDIIKELDVPGKKEDLNKLFAPNSIKFLEKLKTE
jgi:hypothetical protein